MKKIKLRDTYPSKSLANRYFSMEKGQIVTVDDNFPIDKETFEVVEVNGKPVDDRRKELSVGEITILLEISNISNFKERLNDLDLNYNQIQQLLKEERNGRRRKDYLEHMMIVPKPVDVGMKLTSDVLFKNELMAIPKIDEKTARLLVAEFKTKKKLLDDLKTVGKGKAEQAFSRDILDELRKHFQLIKSRVTTKKTMFGG